MDIETKLAIAKGLQGIAGLMIALRPRVSDQDWLNLDLLAADFIHEVERHTPLDVPRFRPPQ
jgi:hypothetical protein